MFNNKFFIILGSWYLQIIIPLQIISDFFVRNFNTKTEVILLLIYELLIFYFVSNFSYWEYTSIYLKYIYYIVLFIGISWMIYKITFILNLPLGRLNDIVNLNNVIIRILIFIAIDCSILLSKIKKKDYINLCFPLRNGKFLIADGGDGRISYFTNYHYYGWKSKKVSNYSTMRFATDIIKINKLGNASMNFLYPSNKDFEIFGENVYSPIDGEIIAVEKNKEDNIPYGMLPNHTGNKITIKNNNYYITMYHFKQYSIVVEVGQKINQGDYIGQVGNSGYSTKPHLHIQVTYSENGEYWFGKSIPIMFDNKNPIKNSVIHAK